MLPEKGRDRLDPPSGRRAPVFAASTPRSEKDCLELRVGQSPAALRGAAVDADPVFCAVSATIADIPWAPAAANAFRSA